MACCNASAKGNQNSLACKKVATYENHDNRTCMDCYMYQIEAIHIDSLFEIMFVPACTEFKAMHAHKEEIIIIILI